ncbi:MAG: phosphoribosylaminoimidazolecarboxamide formyltransferase [Oscillospiraceae bacterium]|nr:phosphoribosylaminoimidazolecarboxamide formyltransferase [Oscillospiraceae bacterium]
MSKELKLKYGCNPNQKPSRIFAETGELPVEALSGNPGYINFMDALNGWQLVAELKEATGFPAAASFKHVSPAGAAIGLPLSDALKKAYRVERAGGLTGLAAAYARARGADRISSYGDFICLSDVCDESAARLIAPQVSDGVIAPGYEPVALEILKAKRGGGYNIIKIDPEYAPGAIERRQIFGVTFEQGRNSLKIDGGMLSNIVTKNKAIPDGAKTDLLVALITLKYTQSNSVVYARDGQTIGVGAGQQSRIACTRLAGDKADNWWLRQSPKVLGLKFADGLKPADMDNAVDAYINARYDGASGEWERVFAVLPDVFTDAEKRARIAEMSGISLGSDAFFPFGDNVERARESGVAYIAQPGGSIRDGDVIEACDRYGMAMAFTGARLFHH